MGIDSPVPADISLFVENGKAGLRTRLNLILYRYDLDTPGHSKCLGKCAELWPPVLAPKDAHPVGDWTLLPRERDARQWAYKNSPTYTYSLDRPGTALGDGKDGVWHILML